MKKKYKFDEIDGNKMMLCSPYTWRDNKFTLTKNYKNVRKKTR